MRKSPQSAFDRVFDSRSVFGFGALKLVLNCGSIALSGGARSKSFHASTRALNCLLGSFLFDLPVLTF